MIRVRHYTSVSAMRKILAQQRLIARDRNCVFVELASRRRRPPRVVEEEYEIGPGRANALIEFDVEPERLQRRSNPRYGDPEYSIHGDVDLTGRNATGQLNR